MTAHVGQQGVAPCASCRAETPHVVINSVQRGRVFLSCRVCGSVHNVAKPEEVRP